MSAPRAVWRTSTPSRSTVPAMAIWTTAIVVLLVALYGIHAQLPDTALKLPGESAASEEAATRVLPQGWAFFTKSPRDPSVEMYRRTGGTDVVKLSATPHASGANSFGLDRFSRGQGPEYAALLERFPEKSWHRCAGQDARTCVREHHRRAHRVVNRTPSPTFCGDVYAVSAKPYPWAWRGLVKGTHKADRAIHLSVTCPGAQR